MISQVFIITVLTCAVYASDDITYNPVEMWDCGGSDKVITFTDTTMNPSPVLYPGNVTIATNMRVLENLPTTNLKVRVMLDKLEPRRMAVPCFQRMGSCVYDVCNEVIPNNQDAFCALGACRCPLITKTYSSAGFQYKLPEIGGRVMARILQGNFDGNITFFNAISNRIYGCMGMRIAIKASNQ